MKDLSLHILDIAENSLRAQADLVEILVIEDVQKDELVLQVKDNGRGMEVEAAHRASDPFFTTKPEKRFGLGLALLAQAAREAEGAFEVSSVPEGGTCVRATFKYGHPDRKPLGDMAATLQVLVAGNRDVDFLYEHRRGAEASLFDTRKVGKL